MSDTYTLQYAGNVKRMNMILPEHTDDALAIPRGAKCELNNAHLYKLVMLVI